MTSRPQSYAGITFQEWGIAHVLAERQLHVPVNQRPYAWGEEEVGRLLQDLTKAFNDNEEIYFLGTIVLTRNVERQWEVADGQQRLATTAILISAIRDVLIELGDNEGAAKYESDYLIEYDPRSRELRPKLELNTEDNEFFVQEILKGPSRRTSYVGQKFSSHQRLTEASSLVRSHIKNLISVVGRNEKTKRLYDFVDFLDQSAVVVVISVPGDVGNAFTMFETLNARGLRASQVDILKNFLFDKARNQIGTLRRHWTSMLSAIETYGEDDLLISYIRHYWISQYGPTTEKDLGEKIRNSVKSSRQAVDLVATLDSQANDYVALLLPHEHPRWIEYGRDVRNCLHIITHELGAEQIRPLMLAVVRNFTPKDAERAFKQFLSWTVRFLVVGGAGGGQVERQYGLRAADVTSGKISTARQLALQMSDFVPNDEAFKSAFAVANIRRSHLARYYLRSLELFQKGETNPQLVSAEDTIPVNLEHILPIDPDSSWHVSDETAQAYHKRLGNTVLLSAKSNMALAHSSFDEKRRTYKASPFVLTADIATYKNWGPKQIEERQYYLAELAPEVWPLY